MKICKGKGETKDYGCGSELPYSTINGIKTYKSKFGLGFNCGCYKSWMTSGSDKANKELNKFAINFKKKIVHLDKQETAKKRIDNKSTDKYRADILQPKINEIARLIDFGQKCICINSDNPEHGGHYIAVGSNRTTCLNLHNIHAQSIHSNTFRGGDDKKYRKGLIMRYGSLYVEFIESLESMPLIKLSKKEMIEVYVKACMISNRLKKDLKILSPDQLIKLRNEINIELGVYSKQYSIFNNE